MSRKALKDIDTKIFKEVIKTVFKTGLGDVSTKKIAQKLGISEPVIFSHFKTKVGLLNATYEYCFNIFNLSFNVPSTPVPFEDLWTLYAPYFNEAMNHPQELVYVSSFKHSQFYDPEFIEKTEIGAWNRLKPIFQKYWPDATDDQIRMLTERMAESFLGAATHICRKQWPDSEATRILLFKTIIYGVYGPQASASLTQVKAK
jgi:AcrR family transcriptional regulator